MREYVILILLLHLTMAGTRAATLDCEVQVNGREVKWKELRTLPIL